MILSKLAAATLVVSIVTSPRIDPAATQHLSIHQKNVAARVYVESATDCIARTVATDAQPLATPTGHCGSRSEGK